MSVQRFFTYLFPLALFIQTSIAQGEPARAVPLGGIGAGYVELLPDGGVGGIAVNNNIHYPIHNPGGSFAAIRVNQGGAFITRELRGSGERAFAAALPGGAFPMPEVRFDDPDVPLNVTLQAFSPFAIRDVKTSTVPAVVWNYRVKNTSTTDMDVAVAFSWQNLIGMGSGVPSGECVQESFTRGGTAGFQFGFTTGDQNLGTKTHSGGYTLLAKQDGGDRVSFLPAWTPSDDNGGFWSGFSTGAFPPNPSRSVKTPVDGNERPAAALSIQRKIPAGRETVFTFILSWHFPYRVTQDGVDHGVYYTNEWDNSRDTATAVANDLDEYREKTEALALSTLEQSIPASIARSMADELSQLVRYGVYLKDGRFALLSKNAQWRGNIGSPEDLLSLLPMFLQAFPNLLASELDLLARCQLVSGEVPGAAGNLETAIGTGDVPGGFIQNPNATTAFTLAAYQYYLWTGEPKLREVMFPHIRTGIGWLIAQDKNGDSVPDGALPDGGSGFLALSSANAYLAALRVGEEIGILDQDLQYQSHCYNKRQEATVNIDSQLWNGWFYQPVYSPGAATVPAQTAQRYNYLPGEWFAAYNGWNTLFDPVNVRASLRVRSQQPVASVSEPGAPFVAPLLLHNGFNQWLNAVPPYPVDGGWALFSALTGCNFDAPRQCLVTGPNLPLPSDRLETFFSAQNFDGQMTVRRSIETGLVECNLDFHQQYASGSTELQQVAFKATAGQDPNAFILKATYNGVETVGQDFTREQMRVFRFNRPLKIREGDRLTLVAVPKNAAKIKLDLKNGEIVNLGARCLIERSLSAYDDQSFRLVNLQREPQMVHLEINDPDGRGFTVFINGKRVSQTTASSEPVPFLLQSSPLPAADYDWLRRMRTGCADAVRFLTTSPNNAIEKSLWDLQNLLETAYQADSNMRGYQIDLVSDQSSRRIRESDFKPDSQAAVDTVATAHQSLDSFLQRIAAQVSDPVKAAELTGYFTPITLQHAALETGFGKEPFTVPLVINNDLNAALRCRISVELPDGWSLQSAENTEYNNLDSPQPLPHAHKASFTIAPSENLKNRRSEIRVVLSGAWKQYAFRIVKSIHVGHSFVNEWLVAGPFPNDGGKGFETKYPMELNIKPDETFSYFDQVIQWQPQVFANGYVDFKPLFSPNEDTIGYAYVGVHTPHEQPFTLNYSADDGIKIIQNYKEILANPRVPPLQQGLQQYHGRFFPGWNHFLVKVNNAQGAWGFYLEFTGANGAPIPELRYATDRAQ